MGLDERLSPRPNDPDPSRCKSSAVTKSDTPARASIFFKVFVKGEDGRWRVASAHATRHEALQTADLLMVRKGVVARVML